ncbi:MAG TPA: hypothetical protein VD860_17130 [Azospirillum sp.]|nr:hypothetical protein [Azospirillum sp.]
MFKFALLILTATSAHHSYFHDEHACQQAAEWIASQGAGHTATCLPLEVGRLESGDYPVPQRKPAARS